ncbi:GNAT family N-acetyltransferase [Streptomyces catenulae]|uniref:GNAT family N-acetyltransferase n=1 Tax=Streptomyces catenulae TaxID=66875 RepID=A0ABV2YVQ8_9ACTN|nr:GNAT family N-acetyltransferase [Streptomyces catenulae]
MRSHGWHLTHDIDEHLGRAGDFLRSRPAPHTMALTVMERLRRDGPDAGGAGAVFGRLERAGGVRAAWFRLPGRGLSPTALTPEDADGLATHLAGLGYALPYVSADHRTAAAFADAWRRHTGAAPTLRQRLHLYRLGALTPPEPCPEGRGRLLGAADHDALLRWCDGFVTAVGETPAIDAGSWAASRFADKRFTFWETPDGTPVSLAGHTASVGGMVRVDPVYTPAHLRGRGYAGAVTAEVSRAALAAGATDVVLFTDPANATSNALYRRLGYVRVTDFAVYDFA